MAAGRGTMIWTLAAFVTIALVPVAGAADTERADMTERAEATTSAGDAEDPLVDAVFFERLDEVRSLLAEYREQGKPLPASSEGRPLLHVAARNQREQAVAILRLVLEAGADVEARDADGKTALHHAADNALQPTCPALLEARPAVDPVDHRGRTPLFYARGANTKLLLDAGADPKRVDADGDTPVTFGLADPVALAAAGLDVNARDADGLTQLHRAALAGDRERAQALLAAGADPWLTTERDYSPRKPGAPPRFDDDPTSDVPAGWTALQIAQRKYESKRWVTSVHGDVADAIRAKTGQRKPLDPYVVGFFAFLLGTLAVIGGAVAVVVWLVVKLVRRA